MKSSEWWSWCIFRAKYNSFHMVALMNALQLDWPLTFATSPEELWNSIARKFRIHEGMTRIAAKNSIYFTLSSPFSVIFLWYFSFLPYFLFLFLFLSISPSFFKPFSFKSFFSSFSNILICWIFISCLFLHYNTPRCSVCMCLFVCVCVCERNFIKGEEQYL